MVFSISVAFFLLNPNNFPDTRVLLALAACFENTSWWETLVEALLCFWCIPSPDQADIHSAIRPTRAHKKIVPFTVSLIIALFHGSSNNYWPFFYLLHYPSTVGCVYDNVILEEFEGIRQGVEAHEDWIAAFFEYIDRTWIGRGIGLRRKRPLSSTSSWNHNATLLACK